LFNETVETCWNWLGILCKRPQVTSKTPAKPKWSKWLSGRSTCRSSAWDLQPNQDQVSFSPQVRTPSPCLPKNMSWTNVNEDHPSLNPGHPAKKNTSSGIIRVWIMGNKKYYPLVN
jgi:hypothetical protein